MYDSLLAAMNEEKDSVIDKKSFYISTMTEAAYNVLKYLFPKESNEIAALKFREINLLKGDDLAIERD